MGKRAKEHKKKVAKRNANIKQQEKMMQKLWKEAFETQMNVMKEKFAAMSGETGFLDNENNKTEEGSEPTELI